MNLNLDLGIRVEPNLKTDCFDWFVMGKTSGTN